MAFAVDSFPLFYLAIPISIATIVDHPFEIFSGYNPFLLTSSFLLLLATMVTFITGWLIKKPLPPELKEFY
jgi:hypothetical protein